MTKTLIAAAHAAQKRTQEARVTLVGAALAWHHLEGDPTTAELLSTAVEAFEREEARWVRLERAAARRVARLRSFAVAPVAPASALAAVLR